jgi:tetratricopeptide (TPR) repeat protein
MGDWTSTIAMGRKIEAVASTQNALPGFSESFKHLFLAGQVWPYTARALAETGDLRGAHALIDRTLPDCYACMRNRADIDAVEGDFNGASYWFAHAISASPSIPMAYFDWGRVLLMKGDIGGAIAKFDLAHLKGPRFADPLEMWGEALLLKNRSDLALARFEEANKYAPRWGRLHLKWGEALFYLGRKDEARAQFQTASGMDLSATDQAALAKRLVAPHG